MTNFEFVVVLFFDFHCAHCPVSRYFVSQVSHDFVIVVVLFYVGKLAGRKTRVGIDLHYTWLTLWEI